MKKLMTILVLFAMCGVAMAQGSSSARTQIPLNNGKHDYVNYQDNNTLGYSGLDYYASSSTTHSGYDTAHVYFKTISQSELTAWNNSSYNTTGQTYNKVVVQFVGTQADSYGNTIRADWIKDYGIYLLDSNQHITDWYSVQNGTNGVKNSFELNPDQAFGVYYKTVDGKTVTTTGNYVANRDTGNAGNGQNTVMVYGEGETTPHAELTYRKYMCVLKNGQSTDFNKHWEFMLQTTLDSPHFDVKPEDFGGNGETFSSGQPLPGTLATLLIGGLCAGALRKRSKKH
jgi:hypothetical protein